MQILSKFPAYKIEFDVSIITLRQNKRTFVFFKATNTLICKRDAGRKILFPLNGARLAFSLLLNEATNI